ncbi:hypothetical protein C0Q70_18704 [Pomacea canaliculata]|uniref:Uncharacterized protein n=1 Tax=Pomacea canaliculata TaxID=400727 RepID=A0A2T7NHB7_POMCA|nr:hypothetical protein C0Q70_18704 [Pomacea canaliculata]
MDDDVPRRQLGEQSSAVMCHQSQQGKEVDGLPVATLAPPGQVSPPIYPHLQGLVQEVFLPGAQWTTGTTVGVGGPGPVGKSNQGRQHLLASIPTPPLPFPLLIPPKLPSLKPADCCTTQRALVAFQISAGSLPMFAVSQAQQCQQ